MRPLSSPCSVGFDVFGRLTSGPFRISGAITMKMISSTNTTSTSGVMLMDACILADSPSRMGHLELRRLACRRLVLRCLGLRYFEQAIHKLRRSTIHLNVESFDLAREMVERDDGRNRDEDSKSGRDQGFSDTARNHRHSPRPRCCDVLES